MLIDSPRITPADRAAWERLERYDAQLARSPRLTRLADQARREIEAFAAGGPCYAGTSWGKDSVVVAHLARGLGLPLVWVRVEPIGNPECHMVRDVFLECWPARYDEIVTECRRDEDGWHASGTLEAGFALAAERYGDRYISGIRAEESGMRKMRMMRWGASTARTCAPIGRWTGLDVFAYLHRHDIPVHPAYAMSMGGRIDRVRLRVASLGGERGTGKGRREWERVYYRDVLEGLEASRAPAVQCVRRQHPSSAGCI